MKRVMRTALPCLLAVAVAATGCGGATTTGDTAPVGGGDGGGGGGGANIYGALSVSSSGTSVLKPGLERAASVGGCTVDAYDMAGAKKGSATSDSEGKYYITGLSANEAYKVIATCGTTKLSKVAKADTKAKTAKTPEVTNPASTVIAAYIMKAIVDAVKGAVDALPNTVSTAVKDSVKTQILSALDGVIAAVEETIKQAMDTGAMPIPTAVQATAVTTAVAAVGDVKNTDNAATASSAVADAVTSNVGAVPPTVDQAVSGAVSSAGGLAACNKSITGNTQAGCTRAFAKFMYTTLGMGVALRLDSAGAFHGDNGGGGVTCNKAWADAAGFPNAKLMTYDATPDANATDPAEESDMPQNYCAIMNAMDRPDRNRTDSGNGGGKDDGGIFIETGTLIVGGQNMGEVTGLLTALATAMYEGYKYTLADLDKTVFDHNVAGKRGLNARYLHMKLDTATGFERAHYLDNGAWVPLKNLSDAPVDPWTLKFDQGSPFQWVGGGNSTDGSPNNNNTLVEKIGASSFKDLGIFHKRFGGQVPTQAELDAWIDQEKTHKDYNPSGEKEFSVLYTEATRPGDNGTNPCWDNNTSTACVGMSGTEYPALRVNVTLGTAGANKWRPITSITQSATGEYYLVPVWADGSFPGIFYFRRAADGREMLDDFFRQRAVKLVLKDTECNSNGLPVLGDNCGAGKTLNAEVMWNCNTPGQPCSVSYKAIGATAVAGGGLSTSLIQSNMPGRWLPYANQYLTNGMMLGHQLVVMGRWENNGYLKYTVNPLSGNDSISLVKVDNQASTGMASNGTQYNLAFQMQCECTANSCGNCSGAKFYLVDAAGEPYVDEDADAGSTVGVWMPFNRSHVAGGTQWPALMVGEMDPATGNITNAAAGLTDSDATSFGNKQFADAVVQRWAFNGPVANPGYKCSMSPFFVDGNANHQLDCDANDKEATGGDFAFNGTWQFNDMKNRRICNGTNCDTLAYPQLENAVLLPRDNAYTFGDPVGAKKLLSTAMNGWFDGAHSITTTTQLDGMQALALVFMFFESGESTWLGNMPGTGLANASGDNKFRLMEPKGEDGVLSMNQLLGAGFLYWHQ